MAAKKNKRFHVEFDVDIPGEEAATIRTLQIENWVRYNCRDRGRLRRDNPLYGKTLDPIYGTLKVSAVK